MNLAKALTLCSLLLTLFVSLSVASTEQQVERIVELIENQSYVKAIELLHDLEKSSLNSARAKSLLASAYMGRGYQLLAANEFYSAREAFQNGRLYNSADLRLWQGEAMAFFKEGRYADASSLLNQAISFHPENAVLYKMLGQSYYAEGRMPEALDALNRAQELGKDEEITKLLLKVRREWQVEQKMEQEYRGHFQLSFVDGGNSSELAAEILEVLEDAYAELGAELNFYPDTSVPVLLYNRREYVDLTGSPDWSGALYDGKIRLPLAGVFHMTDRFAAILYHEYMHVLVHFLSNRHAPVWLNEGLAEIARRRVYEPESTAISLSEDSELLDWDVLSHSFASLDAAQIPMAYEQSHSLARYMVEHYGWYKIKELLERLGKRQDWSKAVAKVYDDYGLDWPAILREWQTSQNK